MHLRNLKQQIILSTFIILVIVNYVFFPRLLLVQIFSLIFLCLIYKRFSPNISKQLYFITILFSIIGYSMELKLTSKYSLYYSYISILIYLFITLVLNIKNIKNINFKSITRNKYILFFVIFVIYCTMSLFFVKDLRAGLNIYATYLVFFCTVVIIYKENKSLVDLCETFSFLKFIYTGVIILGTLEIFKFRYGIMTNYYVMGIPVERIDYFSRIPIVFFYNQNNYAVFLVLGMAALFIAYVYSKTKLSKYINLALFIVSQVNLIFTTSRICWITVFMVFVFAFLIGILVKEKILIRKSINFAILSLLIFFIFSMIPYSAVYYGKFNSTPFLKIFNINTIANINNDDYKNAMVKLGEGGSINIRFTLLYDIIKGVFKDKHYLGFGVGNTMSYVKSLNNTHGFSNAHSLWFEILGDFGIPIFIYFVYTYISIITASFKKYKSLASENKKYILIIITSCLSFIGLAFAPSTVIGFFPFWLLIGISSAAAVINEK